MKKIEAIIREEKLDAVVNALEEANYPGLTVSDVRGLGKQRGKKSDWHGQFQVRTFQEKVRLEVIVHDEDLNRMLQAITDAARTQEFGDGKIFVSDVMDVVRIRTNQRGEVALD